MVYDNSVRNLLNCGLHVLYIRYLSFTYVIRANAYHKKECNKYS